MGRYCLKAMLLFCSLYVEYILLFKPQGDSRYLEKRMPVREVLCLLFGAIFIGRILLQMSLFWHRDLLWVEVFAEAGGIIPLSLACFGFAASSCRNASFGAAEVLALPVFLLGTWLNIWPEYTRYVWKSDPVNAGHLYMGGLFAVSRHINYFGEILSFVGFAMASGTWWTLWIPTVM